MKQGPTVEYHHKLELYTLVEANITLTNEQAAAIAIAFYAEKRPVNPIFGIGELEEWKPIAP